MKPADPTSSSGKRSRSASPAPARSGSARKPPGLNFIDVYHRTGLYPQPLPFIAGRRGRRAWSRRSAHGVTDFKVGDRVAYAGPLGGYAEERLIDADRLVKLPDGSSTEQAAAMMLQGMTAHYAAARDLSACKPATRS